MSRRLRLQTGRLTRRPKPAGFSIGRDKRRTRAQETPWRCRVPRSLEPSSANLAAQNGHRVAAREIPDQVQDELHSCCPRLDGDTRIGPVLFQDRFVEPMKWLHASLSASKSGFCPAGDMRKSPRIKAARSRRIASQDPSLPLGLDVE